MAIWSERGGGDCVYTATATATEGQGQAATLAMATAAASLSLFSSGVLELDWIGVRRRQRLNRPTDGGGRGRGRAAASCVHPFGVLNPFRGYLSIQLRCPTSRYRDISNLVRERRWGSDLREDSSAEALVASRFLLWLLRVSKCRAFSYVPTCIPLYCRRGRIKSLAARLRFVHPRSHLLRYYFFWGCVRVWLCSLLCCQQQGERQGKNVQWQMSFVWRARGCPQPSLSHF